MSKKFDVEAYLRDILDFHPRAANLMMKRKPFVVVACDEPYYMQVYSLIREHEMKIGRWSKEDERNYQAAEQKRAVDVATPCAHRFHAEDEKDFICIDCGARTPRN